MAPSHLQSFSESLDNIVERSKRTWRTLGTVRDVVAIGSTFLALQYFLYGCSKKPTEPDPVNHAPEIVQYTPTNLSPDVQVNTPLRFHFSASDADKDLVQYRMLKDGAIVSDDNDYTLQQNQTGTAVIKGIATDDEGAADTVTWNVTINPLPNKAPIINSYLPLDTILFRQPGDTVMFSFGAKDADPLDYSMLVDDSLVSDTNTFLWHAMLGNHKITGKVSDGKLEALKNWHVQVSEPANRAPYFVFVPNDTTITFPDSVFLQTFAKDDDNDRLSYTYINGLDTLHAPFWFHGLAGDHDIYYLVTDGKDTARAQSRVTVLDAANQSPVAVAQATPSQGNLPLEVYLNSTASHDPDGTIDSVQWKINNQVFRQDQQVMLSTLGSQLLELTVFDDKGAMAKDTAYVSVEDWENPVAAFQLPADSGKAPFSITAMDQSTDNHKIRSRQWRLDGNVIGSAPTLQYTINDPGNYMLWLLVQDSVGNKDSTSHAIKAMPNLAPSVDSIRGLVQGEVPFYRNLTGFAHDPDGSIAQTYFIIEGTQQPNPILFNFTEPKQYQIRFVAVDNDGASKDSLVSLLATDLTAPTAQFSLSADSGDAPFSFSLVNQSTDNHKVDSINILLDGERIGSTSPFNYTVNDTGLHILRLNAWDPSGNLGHKDTTLHVTAPTPISYTLAGTVYDVHGNPVPGVFVQYIDSTHTVVYKDTSDASGVFSLTSLPGTGSFKVWHDTLTNYILAPFTLSQDQYSFNQTILPNSWYFPTGDTTVPVRADWLKDVLGVSPTQWHDPELWYESDFPLKVYIPDTVYDSTKIQRFWNNIDSINTKSGQTWFTVGSAQDNNINLQDGGSHTSTFYLNDHLDSAVIYIGTASDIDPVFLHELFGHGLGLDPNHIDISSYDNGNPTNFHSYVFILPTFQDITNITLGRLLQNSKDEQKRKIELLNYFVN